MKSSITYTSDSHATLAVTLTTDELKKAEQVALVRMGKTIKVPGFRKGHVPAAVVAKHADPAALADETINAAINRAVADAYTEHDIMPLEQPQVEIKKFVPGDTLEFTAESEVLPPVTLGDYKKLKATMPKVSVTAADVNDVLGRIKQQFAEKNEVTRAAKDGDEAVIDFVGKKGDEPFAGGSSNDYPLVLGSKQFIPGFEEAVVGHKAGDEFDVPLTFPKDYSSAELAGQHVTFGVKVKQINEIVEPAETDELAAKIGDFTSMDDVKKDIKAELTAQKEREATDDMRDDVIQQLVDKSKVVAPTVLVDDQVQSIKQDMFQNLMYSGSTMDQYIAGKGFKDLADWEEKEARPLAEKRVKASLVLNQLAKELKIRVTDEALQARLNVYRTQYGNQPEMLKRFDEPEVQRDIANRLATEMTVDKLVELNQK